MKKPIYMLKEYGDTWVLHWRIEGEDKNYKLDTMHENELKRIILEHGIKGNFTALEKEIDELLNSQLRYNETNHELLEE